jgi:hypothetical protein
MNRHDMTRNTARNTPQDHFISPAAHGLEEAISTLQQALQDEEYPNRDKVRVKIVVAHLARLYALEAKRHGHNRLAKEVLQSVDRKDTTLPTAKGKGRRQ